MDPAVVPMDLESPSDGAVTPEDFVRVDADHSESTPLISGGGAESTNVEVADSCPRVSTSPSSSSAALSNLAGGGYKDNGATASSPETNDDKTKMREEPACVLISRANVTEDVVANIGYRTDEFEEFKKQIAAAGSVDSTLLPETVQQVCPDYRPQADEEYGNAGSPHPNTAMFQSSSASGSSSSHPSTQSTASSSPHDVSNETYSIVRVDDRDDYEDTNSHRVESGAGSEVITKPDDPNDDTAADGITDSQNEEEQRKDTGRPKTNQRSGGTSHYPIRSSNATTDNAPPRHYNWPTVPSGIVPLATDKNNTMSTTGVQFSNNLQKSGSSSVLVESRKAAKQRRKQLMQACIDLRVELDRAEEKKRKSKAELNEMRKREETVQRDMSELERREGAHSKVVSDLLETGAQARKQAEDLRRRLESKRKKQERLETKREKKKQEEAKALEPLVEISTKTQVAEERIGGLNGRMIKLRAELEEARRNADGLKQQEETLKRRLEEGKAAAERSAQAVQQDVAKMNALLDKLKQCERMGRSLKHANARLGDKLRQDHCAADILATKYGLHDAESHGSAPTASTNTNTNAKASYLT